VQDGAGVFGVYTELIANFSRLEPCHFRIILPCAGHLRKQDAINIAIWRCAFAGSSDASATVSLTCTRRRWRAAVPAGDFVLQSRCGPGGAGGLALVCIGLLEAGDGCFMHKILGQHPLSLVTLLIFGFGSPPHAA
jgi:hypothetical protein